MVFSSVPLYLDPPNWQQQHEIHQNTHQLQAAMGSSSSISERARLEKIPVPEGPLNCPRCDSTNTKFCYFNNYNLSQPRHFCKSCRRYWTRGGALRNVPVGGGCRRNKRRKRPASSSKSSAEPPKPAAGEQQAAAPDQHLVRPAPSGPFSFMASLQNMTSTLGMGNFGLFGAPPPPPPHHHQQQLSSTNLLGGFGGVELPMYPFQINGGAMETASAEMMRSRAGQLSTSWSGSLNNTVAGSPNPAGFWD